MDIRLILQWVMLMAMPTLAKSESCECEKETEPKHCKDISKDYDADTDFCYGEDKGKDNICAKIICRNGETKITKCKDKKNGSNGRWSSTPSCSTESTHPTTSDPNTDRLASGDTNVAAYVSVTLVIIVLVIVGVVVFIVWRRRRHGGNFMFVRRYPKVFLCCKPHKVETVDDGIITADQMAIPDVDNPYADISEVDHITKDNVEETYNTIDDDEPIDEYNHLGDVPGTIPRQNKSNTSELNPIAGAYSTLGANAGPQSARQKPVVDINTYSHTEHKTKPMPVTAEESYSHISMEHPESNQQKSSVNEDQSYSHLDEKFDVKKVQKANGDSAEYNILGAPVNQDNRDGHFHKADDNTGYDHLVSRRLEVTANNAPGHKPANQTNNATKIDNQGYTSLALNAEGIVINDDTSGALPGSHRYEPIELNKTGEVSDNIGPVDEDKSEAGKEETSLDYDYFVLEKRNT